MRIGGNPAKGAEASCIPPKGVTLAFVVWVPQLEGYFRALLEVFRLALLSARANTSIPFDVLVVDNASCSAVDRFLRHGLRDGTIQYHLRSDRNLGVVNATVQALRAAPGEFVVYADCDVFFRNQWLEQLIAVKQAFPEVAIVSGVPMRNASDAQIENVLRVFGSDRDTVVEEGDLLSNEILREWAESVGRTLESYLSATTTRESDVRLRRGAVTAYAGGIHMGYLTTPDMIDRSVHPRTDKLVQPRAAGFDMQMSALGLPWVSTPEPVFFHLGNRLGEGWVQSEYARLVGRRPPHAACAVNDSQPGLRRTLRRTKPESDASPATAAAAAKRFLRQEYGLSGRDLAARARLALLDEVEHVGCDLCGADDPELVAERDKYGLPVRAVMCRRCGLMYLNPRPSADRYRAFRGSGRDGTGAQYHRLAPRELEDALREYFGRDFSIPRDVRKRLASAAAGGSAQSSRDADSSQFAWHVYNAARDFVPFAGAVFEQSAVDGAHLLPWRDQHGCTADVADPAAEAYDLVFNARTIDHQTDPLSDLREAHRILRSGGVVFVEAPEIIEAAKLEGLERHTIDIDRPHLFTARTLPAMAQAAGFEIIRTVQQEGHAGRRASSKPSIQVYGRKTHDPVAVDWPTFEEEWEKLAELPPEKRRRRADFSTRHERRVRNHAATTTSSS